MKLNKPAFWDYKSASPLVYLLLPFTLPFFIRGLFLKPKEKDEIIKTICVGNIYVGGTGKTPLSIEINRLLLNLNYNTGFIKKYYKDQEDEQKLLSKHGKIFCKSNRLESLNDAINDNKDIVIFDDGLQDNSIKYNLSIVCFNSLNFVGNNFLIPAGPLREKISSLKKYKIAFLNGESNEIPKIKEIILNQNSSIRIFEANYVPTNLDKINLNDKFLVFSGIGNPASFEKTLLKNNFNITKFLKFPDHYNYKEKDINKIKSMAKKLNVKILTTEKDYNRLNDLYKKDIHFLEIKLSIKNEKDFTNFLEENL